MASDTQDFFRRRHRRSSDDESEEPSKRRKHRHHHRHHRHSSRKQEEDETKCEEEEIIADKREDIALLPPPPIVGVVSGLNWRPDYDMEEGEIVEDEGLGVGDGDTVKKGDSDVESGEFNAVEVRGESDNYNMGVHEAQDGVALNSSLPPEGNLGRRGQDSGTLGEEKSDDEWVTSSTVDTKENRAGGSKIHDEAGVHKNSSAERNANGDIGHDSCREDSKLHIGSGSPKKGSRKRKSYYDDESDTRDRRKLLSSENTGEKHKILTSSSSRDKYYEEVHSRNRLRSRDRARERSRSQSILQEAPVLKTTHQRDAAHHSDSRKTMSDLDDEEMVGRYRDYRHGSRDLLRDKERERSSSYSRYAGRVDRHHSRETWDRERVGGRENWDREMEGSRETRERDRVGREMDRDRKREDWDRDLDQDRDRQRTRDRDRERERDRERKRERDRDRIRDKDRNKEGDRLSRQHRKYENVDDDRDRCNDSRHRRHDEKDHKDKVRKNDQEKVRISKNDHLEREEDKLKRDEDEPEDYQERIALQLEDHEEEDLNRIKEESRKRRQAILEKYKTQQLQKHESHSEDIDKKHMEQPSDQIGAVNVVPEVLDGRSEGADIYVAEPSFSVGKPPPQNGISAFERTSGAGGLGEGTPKSERSTDMFSDDIFGESPTGVRKPGKGDGLAIERSGLHDNWDDAEGYYSYRFGEILDGRYEVTAAHGKGVFSTVVRAKDLKAGSGDPEEVAIKIIRNNETMYKAGLDELVILKKLVGADPENRRHCVRFLSSFKYRNHLCLVFESLHMNLREVLKKFGRNIGLKLTAVRAYTKQLFIALKHLRNCGVLHCDIKPDNMLVNEAKNVLKLCDFGNAMFAGKNEITPYLVSRFYRAPEIILGLPYDHPMDIWSVGCCLFELSTGKVLFPGPTNNDMLRLHMELKGPFPKKMLRKGAFTDQHFDQDLNFLATEEDPVTKKTIKRLILNIKPKDIGTIVMNSPGEDPKMLANFKDLLEKIFVLDPDKSFGVVEVKREDVWSGDLLPGGSFSGMCSVSIERQLAIGYLPVL
ncbi:hypothetical protein F0562_032755 [Nyssa sinensis]|uniref:Serine/threonine-protein kinase PRP4 homolog n=1 Tax=Nyssa sinensis TaxID=561372 RepID=A0A5J5ASN0_9ASTE|nr:hypothetical protein F0562_032755 [Nyssa sinensis]